MSAIPLAVPLAWTSTTTFFLQIDDFGFATGRDCWRHREFIR